MDFGLPPDDDPRRLEVRAWLDAHPDPTGRQLAEAGYVVPHWPAPWGLDADPMQQLIIDEELHRAGVRRGGGIGIGWAAPTILLAGTEEQRRGVPPQNLRGGEAGGPPFPEPPTPPPLAHPPTPAARARGEDV